MSDKITKLGLELCNFVRDLLTKHTEAPSDLILEMAFRDLYETRPADFGRIVDEIDRRHTSVITGGDIPLRGPLTIRYQGKRRTVSAELLPFDELGIGNGLRDNGRRVKLHDWWGVLSRITTDEVCNPLGELLDQRDISLGLLEPDDAADTCPAPATET